MRIVVIPMAGMGSRFTNVHADKKLAPVPPRNDPMFIHVIKHFNFSFDQLYLISQHSDSIIPVLDNFPDVKSRAKIIETITPTKGPLDTVLYAESFLRKHPDAEIVICNCDQVLVWPGDWALSWFKSRGAVGGIPTIERNSNRHSYAQIDPQYSGKIIKVREKEKISTRATIGVYWFSDSISFLQAAKEVIAHKDTAPNGEFYVAHAYNYLKGLILEYPLCEFWSLGEPENFQNYLTKNYTLGEDA